MIVGSVAPKGIALPGFGNVRGTRPSNTIGIKRPRVVSRAPEELAAFAELPAHVIGAIDCWYVFGEQDKVTPNDWAPRAREALGERYSDVALGGGTDLYFTEVNREPPDPSMFDVLNLSMNPQVHAFDTRTLIQNAMTQSVVAANAPRLTRATPVSVSPISLRPRFNPNAMTLISTLPSSGTGRGQSS
mgnify:CR=1 FL=1